MDGSGARGELWPEVVLDYSYSTAVSVRIAEKASESLIFCMYEDCLDSLPRARGSADTMAISLEAYLHSLNFTRVFLGVTASPFYQQIAKHLISQESLTFTQVTYLRPGLSSEEVEQFVGRVLKPTGSTVAVLLVDEPTGKLLHPALQQYDLYKKGYAYFFSAEAVWATRPEGAFFLVESAALNVTSRLEFEALIIEDLLSSLYTSRQSQVSMSLSLVNIYEGSPIVLNSLSAIHFPGNTTSFPYLSKPIIEVLLISKD
jgi:hypothetical protein